jgi:succinoglycan biosynthesis protein ExoA
MAGAAAKRSVLVVIPTLNEAGSIAQVLRSLRDDPPPDAAISMVVVDGGSTDGTVDVVRRLAAADPAADPKVSVLANPARIQSAGINLAARTAGHGVDVLVRCDAHAAYPRGYIRQLLDTLERTGADAVVVAMDSVAGRGCLQRAVAWVSDTALGSGGSAHRGGRASGFVDHGHHAAFRMPGFLRLGGYDESFTHNEDAELDCRQRRLGGRIYLDADIRVGYYPRATLGGLEQQYFRYGYGRSRTARRHPGSIRARQLAVPLHFALSVLALALAPMWPALLAWPLLYVAALGLASLQAAWRHRSVCGLLAGGAAGVMHLSWAAGFFAGLVSVRERPWRGALQVP